MGWIMGENKISPRMGQVSFSALSQDVFGLPRLRLSGVATKFLFMLSYMTYLSIQLKMADHDMSPLHGKKPCRACTSFKSWMKQENRRKSTSVSLNLTMELKESEHTHAKKVLNAQFRDRCRILHHTFGGIQFTTFQCNVNLLFDT